jgi:hypothetical protein
MLLVLLALLIAPAAAAQPADTTRPGLEIGFNPRLGAFYSPTKGFGAGGRVTLRNALWTGSEVRVEGRLQQRYAEAGASVYTGDPFEAAVFAGVGGRYVDDRVRAFYGIGPRSLRTNKVYAEVESVEGEVRLGWHPLGAPRLLVQPVVRLLHHRTTDFRDARDDAFANLDPASQRNLLGAVAQATTGVTYGLELAFDTRDRLFYASRGALVLLTARRYDGFDEPSLAHYTTTASLFGFVPMPARRHVLFGRAVLAMAHPVGDAPLPFSLLPVLDDDLLGTYTAYRFTGNDLVALTLGYRLPVFTLLNWFALDANVLLSAANAYDDVFDQLEPGLTFDTDRIGAEGARTPLRPSVSVGLDVVNLDEGRIVIGGQMGIDPEGYRFGTMRLVYGIRDARPAVR